MPRFAANLSLLYQHVPLLERIDAAARDGFAACEVQSPYSIDAAEFRRALDDARMRAVLINAPAGKAEAGERGLAALVGREADFRSSLAVAIDYARAVGAPRIHLMAGVVDADDAARAEAGMTYRRNLAAACRAVANHSLQLTIEPINPRDMPGYFLNSPQLAAEVIAAVGDDRLKMQFDCYHAQIITGDLTRQLQRCFPLIGHVQVADVPDRGEPGTGEINYPHLFGWLDRHGYDGWVGCEYRPVGGDAATSAGLGWMRRF